MASSTPSGKSKAAQDVILYSSMDVRNKEQVAQLREKLLAWSESDHEKFSTQAREFFRACGVPVRDPHADNATTVSSFINGAPLYAIANTTHSEFDVIHGKVNRGAKLWNSMPLEGRQEFFRIMAEEVGKRYKAAIDLAITLEVGKAGSEFSKTIAWDEWAASAPVGRHLSGTFVMDDLGRRYYLSQIRYIPADASHVYFYESSRSYGLGICGSTNGFNYPAALAVPDVVCSRVCGNGFIGKVPSKAPSFLYIRKLAENEAIDLMAKRFSDYAWAAKAKAGGVDLGSDVIVRRLKNGFGIVSGRDIIESWAKECTTLRVVGGKEAGKVFREHRKDVDPRMEHTILELAGNNPVVIMPSAASLEGGLEAIVATLAEGNKSNSGQRCTSPRRWLVHRDVYEAVKQLAVTNYQSSANNENTAIDNPLHPDTEVGAMDKGGFNAAQKYLDAARKAGATIIGGNRVLTDRFPDAYYMTPALVLWDGVPDKNKKLMHAEEVFAPIANLEMVDDLQDAIAKTNLSTENLSGGFYCDEAHVSELCRFIAHTNLGSLIHNGPPKDLSPGGVHAGRDDGGVGITGSLQSLEQYMRPRQENNIRLLARVDSITAAKKLADEMLATK